MLRPISILVVAVLFIGAFSETTVRTADDKPTRTVKTGKIVLKEGFSRATVVEVGQKFKATSKLYITEFFGKKLVSAQLDIENPTKEKLSGALHVVFFDKKNNVMGCTAQEGTLEPGEKTSFGSLLARIPYGDIKKIASYQIVFYEDTKEIGSR